MNAKKEWALTEDMMRGQFRDASTEWAGKAWERYGHSGESFGSVGELKRYLTSKGFTDIQESGKGFTAKKDGYEWTIEYSTFANTKSGAKSITGVMTHKMRKIKDPNAKSGLKKLFGKDALVSGANGENLNRIKGWQYLGDNVVLAAAEKKCKASLREGLGSGYKPEFEFARIGKVLVFPPEGGSGTVQLIVTYYAKSRETGKTEGFEGHPYVKAFTKTAADSKDVKPAVVKSAEEWLKNPNIARLERWSDAYFNEVMEVVKELKKKDTKDEMSIVGDMMNGKFSKDAIPMSAVSVRGEDRYAFSIGHKPSGNGHWCFRIGDKEFWVTGYYTDAKKAAIREAARLGEYTVTVLT